MFARLIRGVIMHRKQTGRGRVVRGKGRERGGRGCERGGCAGIVKSLCAVAVLPRRAVAGDGAEHIAPCQRQDAAGDRHSERAVRDLINRGINRRRRDAVTGATGVARTSGGCGTGTVRVHTANSERVFNRIGKPCCG